MHWREFLAYNAHATDEDDDDLGLPSEGGFGEPPPDRDLRLLPTVEETG